MAGAGGPPDGVRVTGQKRPIRLIYDTSAIVAFAHGSVHPGELLSVIAEEGGVVGLPASCLAEAEWIVRPSGMLDALLDHYATELITTPQDWNAVGALQAITGLQDAARAVLYAIDLDCDVMSARPLLYSGIAGAAPVLPIPD
jgi:hypothetical protein